MRGQIITKGIWLQGSQPYNNILQFLMVFEHKYLEHMGFSVYVL